MRESRNTILKKLQKPLGATRRAAPRDEMLLIFGGILGGVVSGRFLRVSVFYLTSGREAQESEFVCDKR